MRKILFLSVLFFSSSVFAQELNCTVQVLSPQIQGTTDKKILESLESSLFQLMNNTKWTKDNFKPEERIDCSVVITVIERTSTDEWKANIQVQARRPVYMSSYYAVLLSRLDEDFSFKYVEFQPIEYSENTYLSELASVLGYYANIIIGEDYDSFSLNGGTPYFQKAQQIVNFSQNSPFKGWRSFESQKNRYWLIENILNARYAPMRECMYAYHRKGLDVMHMDKEGGRAEILKSLLLLKKVHQQQPLSFNMQVFFNGKADEVINIFSGAMPDEKQKVTALLTEIDPGNAAKYQRIGQ